MAMLLFRHLECSLVILAWEGTQVTSVTLLPGDPWIDSDAPTSVICTRQMNAIGWTEEYNAVIKSLTRRPLDGAGEFSDKLPKCALLFQAVGGRKLPSSRKPLSRSSNRCCLFAPRRTQIPMKMQNTIASGDDDAQPNL